MQAQDFSVALKTALAILAVILIGPGRSAAQQEGTLHNFGNGTDGRTVYGGVISDASGNLYGTTFDGGPYDVGGPYGAGTVFELSPQANGTWSETILYSFGQSADGTGPAAGLAIDSAGNLYGTTEFGGGSGGSCQGGCGIVFQLRPPAGQGGSWTESILYRFAEQYRGDNPQAGVILDSAGQLYGTTNFGGTANEGIVYRLTPKKGEWSIRVLYSFGASSTDAGHPTAGLTFDAAGNLYGTTAQGGAYGAGTVFELAQQPSGAWRETILHSFNPSVGDGSGPQGPVIFGGANLYGTTFSGGAHNLGTVFELKAAQGTWAESLLHNFGANANDGTNPAGGLAFDGSGNLYGMTNLGGTHLEGTLFLLAPGADTWTEHILHLFGGGTDGKYPYGGFVLTSAGVIYGACIEGGVYYNHGTRDNGGTVFEVRTR